MLGGGRVVELDSQPVPFWRSKIYIKKIENGCEYYDRNNGKTQDRYPIVISSLWHC